MADASKWQLVAWAVVAALVVFAGARMVGDRGAPPPEAKVEGPAGGGARPARLSGADGRAGVGSGGALYVHVAGAVRRPGLLRVPEGARVAVAIARAGGPARRADLTGVNLAQALEDGQQVIVPLRGARGASAAAGSGGAGGPAGAAAPSLATATVEQLDRLDGIGPALAKRILDYREAHGGFRSIDELREVDGIGEKRFSVLRKALRP